MFRLRRLPNCLLQPHYKTSSFFPSMTLLAPFLPPGIDKTFKKKNLIKKIYKLFLKKYYLKKYILFLKLKQLCKMKIFKY